MVPKPKRYPKDQRDRAVRMVLDRLDEYPSLYAACGAIAPKLGVGSESLRQWMLQSQIDSGQRSGPISDELAEIKSLKNRVRDLVNRNFTYCRTWSGFVYVAFIIDVYSPASSSAGT